MKTTKASILAELTGVTERRLRQMADEGHIPKATRGNYPTAATLKALFKYFRTNSGDLKTRHLEQKTRESEERANLLEMDRKERERETVRMAEARGYVTRLFQPMREQLLELPNAWCARVNPSDPALAREALGQWVDQCLAAVREDKVKAAND